jgi:hypothetical protein
MAASAALASFSVVLQISLSMIAHLSRILLCPTGTERVAVPTPRSSCDGRNLDLLTIPASGVAASDVRSPLHLLVIPFVLTAAP